MRIFQIKQALDQYDQSQWSIRKATRSKPNPDIIRLSRFYDALSQRHAYDLQYTLNKEEEKMVEAMITRRVRWKEKSGAAFSGLHLLVSSQNHSENCQDDELMNRFRQFENVQAEMALLKEHMRFKSTAKCYSPSDAEIIIKHHDYHHEMSNVLYLLKHYVDTEYSYEYFMRVMRLGEHSVQVMQAMNMLSNFDAKHLLTKDNIQYLLDNPRVAIDLALLMFHLAKEELLTKHNILAAIVNKDCMAAAVWYVQHGLSDCPEEQQEGLDVFWKYAVHFSSPEVMTAFREAMNAAKSDGFDILCFFDQLQDNMELGFEGCVKHFAVAIKEETQACKARLAP